MNKNYQTLTGDHFDMFMAIGNDCLVFSATTFSCLGESITKNAIRMVAEAKKLSKTKVVIVGDCDEHITNECSRRNRLAAVMQDTGLEYVWLWQECEDILIACPDFDLLGIRNFSDANAFNLTRLLLNNAGGIIRKTTSRIQREREYLLKYPIVARVAGLESHDHHKMMPYDLFDDSQSYREIISRKQLVCLFQEGLKVGVIVLNDDRRNEDYYITFQVANDGSLSLEMLHNGLYGGYKKGKGSSLRIIINGYTLQFSLYLETGKWMVEEHLVPWSDGYGNRFGSLSSCEFIPMSRRVKSQPKSEDPGE